MISKSAMLVLVKGFRASDVDKALSENPKLKDFRDERGRNWLHICCGRKPGKGRERHSVRTAEVLLRHGFDINGHAFKEGQWKATPLWFAVGRGENLALTKFLLERGANPNYSLWAASFHDNVAALRLLVRHGADLEDPSVPYESPLLGAVKWSHFIAAEELLKLGANPNSQDKAGMTALHLMLKKNSDKKHIAMLVRHGARGDIKNKAGVTAIDILRRKRDAELKKFAEKLAHPA